MRKNCINAYVKSENIAGMQSISPDLSLAIKCDQNAPQ